jgi:hypothetical protein
MACTSVQCTSTNCPSSNSILVNGNLSRFAARKLTLDVMRQVQTKDATSAEELVHQI